MKKFIIITCFLFPLLSYAQDKVTLRGLVTDSSGESVIGAAVMVGQTNPVGAITDLDGRYSISIPDVKGAPIAVSCMGYATIHVVWNGETTMDFTMSPETELLEETVVVGYGAMKRSDLTGSVTSVRIDETDAGQSASIDQLISGQAAGVNVVSNSAAPDGGVSIQIRGASSFGSTEPLYVVDGIILNTSSSMSLMNHSTDGSGGDEATNGLMGINPQDIASIEILKDASATAIYGSQGANGVVLITTKKANTDQPRIRFNVGIDVGTPYKKQDIMSYDEYIYYLLLMEAQTLNTTLATSANTKLTNATSGKVIPIDWQDYVMRNTLSQRYYLSVSGKPKKTNYLFSLGYNNAKGIIQNTGFQNFTARLNFDRQLGKRVDIGVKMSASYLDSELTQGASTGGNLGEANSLMRSMVSTSPYTYKFEYDDDGDIIDIDGDDTNLAGPDRWLQGFVNNKKEFRLTPSAYLKVKILKSLTFDTTFGADYRVTEQSKFRSNKLSYEASGATAAVGQTDRLAWNWDTMLNFNRKFQAKHNLSATLGMSLSMDNFKEQVTEGINIDQWKAKDQALNSAPYSWFTYGESYSSMMSFFARAIYNYRERYVLTATWRLDGSSRFAKQNKWANFPSFAAAWRINQEPWFNVPVISMAKLRVGWGQVGKQAANPYYTITNYTTGYYPNHESDSQKVTTVLTSNFPNLDLKWETTEQTNIGLDFGLWQGRVSFTVDAYYKLTKDLLQQKTIAGSSGLSNPYVNMGSIENKGIEISADLVPLKIGDFEWTLSGNISFNRNKILSINPDGTSSGEIYLSRDNRQLVEYFDGDIIGVGDVLKSTLNIFVQGLPVSQFYGLLADGLVPEGETGVPYGDGSVYRGPGSVNYVDLNGDNQINDQDRTIIGDPNPDFTYGFKTAFSFKNLNVSASFIGSHGNDIYNINKMMDTNTSNVNKNVQRSVVTQAWTPENTDTWYPALGAMSGSDVKLPSSRYVEDGSYLRISNISVSYFIPFKKKNHFYLRNMSVGASVGNPWFWTKYSGWDPNVNSYGSIKKKGADMGSYPGARTFKFDLKFTF